MKFSCERCGKKYATAANPAPGKVYKLRCKACGHLIVVRAAASSASPAPARVEALGAIVEPAGQAPPSEIPVEIDAPASAPPNGADLAGSQITADFAPDATSPEGPAAASPEEQPRPPPVEPGYVDLFSDLGGPDEADAEGKKEAPFLAAARASLPENYGAAGGAPDPLGALLQEPGGAVPPPLPKVPDIPKPPAQKRGLSLVLIGLGVVVLIAILAFALLGSGNRPPGIPPRPAQVRPVSPPAQGAEAPPPAAEPPPAR